MTDGTRVSDNVDSLLQVKQQAFIANATEQALKRLSDAKTDDVTEIAASQIELLSRFYDLSLSQASRSFRWALVASIIGFLFLLAALAFPVINANYEGLSDVALIGSAISSFIAAVNFYLYGQTLSQLNLFQGRLEVTQRFLLANSLCESLSDDYKDHARARLIAKLSGYEADENFRQAKRPRRRPPASRYDDVEHPADDYDDALPDRYAANSGGQDSNDSPVTTSRNHPAAAH